MSIWRCVQVVVAAESPEDWHALRMLTTAVALRLLAEQGIAREVPLFGKLQVRRLTSVRVFQNMSGQQPKYYTLEASWARCSERLNEWRLQQAPSRC